MRHFRDLEIPDEGRVVHLRGYGGIKVFKFETEKGRIDYIGKTQKILLGVKLKKFTNHVGVSKFIIVN